MGGLILGVNTLYRVFCFFKLLIIGGKELINSEMPHCTFIGLAALGNYIKLSATYPKYRHRGFSIFVYTYLDSVFHLEKMFKKGHM